MYNIQQLSNLSPLRYKIFAQQKKISFIPYDILRENLQLEKIECENLVKLISFFSLQNLTPRSNYFFCFPYGVLYPIKAPTN